MSIIITALTIVLVINCLFLILLVLIQLPKKDAGAGIAFGGGATDALFGAGQGNALTQITKYAAGTFMVLAVFLGVLNARAAGSSSSELRQQLANQRPATPAPAAAASPFQTIITSNALTTPPTVTATNAALAPAPVVSPATNVAAPR